MAEKDKMHTGELYLREFYFKNRTIPQEIKNKYGI